MSIPYVAQCVPHACMDVPNALRAILCSMLCSSCGKNGRSRPGSVPERDLGAPGRPGPRRDGQSSAAHCSQRYTGCPPAWYGLVLAGNGLPQLSQRRPCAWSPGDGTGAIVRVLPSCAQYSQSGPAVAGCRCPQAVQNAIGSDSRRCTSCPAHESQALTISPSSPRPSLSCRWPCT